MITALDQNTALVLIDLQHGILNLATGAHEGQEVGDLPSIPQVLTNAAQLVNKFREKSLPIVVVNVNSFGEAWTQTRKDNVLSGTQPPSEDYLKIVDEIETSESDIFITKHSWSAFFNTGLHERLQALNITNIVLGGVATSIGVEGTARDASVLAYNLSFASDAMSDFSLPAHQHSLARIFPRIGEVGSTQDILKQLD